jgi:HEAT repeat protein
MGIRALKKDIRHLLLADDFESTLPAFDQMAERQAVNPLISFFYDTNITIRWHAITAFGRIVSNLADKDMEAARVMMRRLLWNLNDESGGIGWGSPEAMGETMALHSPLADQYSHLLVAFVNPQGNFLEHEVLQRGLLWGLGRLAHARPEQLHAAIPYLHPFLESPDPFHRGYAAWTIGALKDATAKPLLKKRMHDDDVILLYHDLRILRITVGKLAHAALDAITDP